ncbi:putative pumilio homolog 19 [Brassica napus]|uniref:putative pumilio homolog 19 n=1 Tax=Brassica napus TaxID=3708 RepID=UPI0020795827|nr:putative pumilio homolog 19 [Brassica napus]
MANRGDHPTVPPPRRRFTSPPRRVTLTEENQSLLNSFRSSAALTPQETATCTQSLFNLMTSSDASQFRELVSRLGYGSDLRRMVSLLTSNTAPFLQTARNANGSNRMQDLIGKTDDVDNLFLIAILRRFFDVMCDCDSSRVALRGLRVFSQEKRAAMHDHVLHGAVDLALDPNGYVVLNEIINGLDPRSFYGDRLLYVVARNAHQLSDHAFGSRVVQRVLQLNDLRCTRDVAVSLRGHCVYLSLTKYGSYVVEMLLDTEEEAVMVADEFLWGCNGEKLALLARNEFGSFVVLKALRVTREMYRRDLFGVLVDKLMPFVHHLGGFHGRVRAFLDSL